MSKENMTIESDIRDIEEIEIKFEILSESLIYHYTRIGAQAVVLTAVLDKVDELKEELAKEENT